MYVQQGGMWPDREKAPRLGLIKEVENRTKKNAGASK